MTPIPSAPRLPILAPSILSADFAHFAEALAIVDPARDWVHCDVMDNHFVPNLTFGPLVVAAAETLTTAPLDVHLMIENPERLIGEFARAGADMITVHFEACEDPAKTLSLVRKTGAKAGLAIKPGTPFEAAAPFLSKLDMLLVMTVEPGFGGQAFMPDMLKKVRAAVAARASRRQRFLIEVDGGISATTAREAREAGAEVFVAGHAVYRQSDPVAALETLRAAVGA